MTRFRMSVPELIDVERVVALLRHRRHRVHAMHLEHGAHGWRLDVDLDATVQTARLESQLARLPGVHDVSFAACGDGRAPMSHERLEPAGAG